MIGTQQIQVQANTGSTDVELEANTGQMSTEISANVGQEDLISQFLVDVEIGGFDYTLDFTFE